MAYIPRDLVDNIVQRTREFKLDMLQSLVCRWDETNGREYKFVTNAGGRGSVVIKETSDHLFMSAKILNDVIFEVTIGRCPISGSYHSSVLTPSAHITVSFLMHHKKEIQHMAEILRYNVRTRDFLQWFIDDLSHNTTWTSKVMSPHHIDRKIRLVLLSVWNPNVIKTVV